MKNLFFLLIAVVAMASMQSCDTDEFQPDSSMVNVELSPTLSSGYITRTTAADMYSQMYEKIASRELLADSYSLTFTETTTGKSYTFTGNWGSSILIKSGTYRVVGTSTAIGDIIQEKGSLRFNTVVTIKPSDRSIILTAEWNSSLLLFDKNVINNVSIHYGINNSKVKELTLFESGNIIYCFANEKIYNENCSIPQFLIIDYADNSRESIYTNDKVFEAGKYYTWDGNNYIKSGISIPMMTQGNIWTWQNYTEEK